MSPENSQRTRELSSLSCNRSALDQEQRKRHNILTKDVFPKHLEIKELPDGYGFRFPNNRLLFIALSEWITLEQDRKSTRLNSSHVRISYAVFCLKKKIIHSRPKDFDTT